MPKSRDEEKGPALVFADPTQSIFLADMAGGGFSDIVRIRYSEVCYWPTTVPIPFLRMTYYRVSIHSRLLGREIRVGFGIAYKFREVSIHSRLLGREIPPAASPAGPRRVFQSTPGF